MILPVVLACALGAPLLGRGAVPAPPVQESSDDVVAALDDARALYADATAALEAGDRDVAIDLCRQVVALASAAEVIDTPSADALLWNTSLHLGRLEEWEAAVGAKSIVADRRTRLEPDDAQRLWDAHYGAAYHAEKHGLVALAAKHYPEAYRAGAQLRAPDDAQLLEVRSRAGRMLFHARRFEEARAWTRAALEDHLRTLGPEHVHTITARNDLSFVLTEMGEYRAALELIDDSLLVATESRDADPFGYAWVLQQRGDLLRALGRREEALDLFQRALDGFRTTEPVRMQFVVLAGQRVGTALAELGHFDEAQRQYEVTIEIAKRSGEYDDATQVSIGSRVAGIQVARGDLQGARATYESLLAVARRSLAAGDALRSDVVTGLANCLMQLGEPLVAVDLYERDLADLIANYGEAHVLVATSRSNLASALAEVGRNEEARDLMREVVATLRANLGDEHPRTTLAEMNLAALEMRTGDLERAYDLAEKGLERRRTQLAAHDPKLLEAVSTLGAVCARTGRRDRAIELYEEVLGTFLRTRPAHDLAVIDARQALVRSLVTAGRRDEATALARTQLRAMRDRVRDAAGRSSARELELLPAEMRRDVAALAALARSPDPDDRLDGVEEEVFTTFELLRATSALGGALAAIDDAGVAQPTEEERTAAEALARAVRDEAPAAALDDARARLTVLRRARQERLAALPGAAELLADPTPEAIGAELGDGGVAIGFVVERAPTPSGARATGSLVAQVVDAAGAMTRIPLGPLDAIHAAAADWRAALGVGRGAVARGAVARGLGDSSPRAADVDERAAGARLRELIWDPIRERVSGAERVVVALDGPLHTLPLDALPLAGGRLGDRTPLEVRSTLTELTWRRDAPEPGGLLAVGGVAFSRAPVGPDEGADEGGDEGADEPVAVARLAETSGHVALLRSTPWESGFVPLAATEDEARELAALADELDVAEAEVLRGARASRELLERLAPRARFLHIATHGWFASGALAETTSASYLTRADRVRGVSPMALSGLALAGANLTPDELGGATGLVTAEEIASWDLAGCELAVLSACETSVGVIDDGRGAASLQKALHLAGARTVVASLWQVPDGPTRELMLEFYRRTWTGTPKAQALWEAKATLRERRDADGEPLYEPRDWAAWVLTGDPR